MADESASITVGGSVPVQDSIDSLAAAIKALNENIANLSDKMSDLADNSEEARDNLQAVASATGTASAAATGHASAANAAADATEKLGESSEKAATALDNTAKKAQNASETVKSASSSIKEVGETAEESKSFIDELGESFEALGRHGRTLSIAAEALNLDFLSSSAKVTAGAEAIKLAFADIAPAALAATAGIALLASGAFVIDEATKAAGEWDRQIGQVTNSLHNQGMALDQAKSAVEQFADSQESLTAYSRDETVQALQRVTAAGTDYHDAMILVRVASDAASATGRSLLEVTTGLMEAEHGRARALTELGIGTKDTIHDGMSLQQVLDTIEKQMGGSASTSVQNYDGALDRLKNQFDTLEVQIGEKFLPVLVDIVNWLEKGVEYANDHFDEWVEDLQPVWEAFKFLAETIEFVFTTLEHLVQFWTSVPGVITATVIALVAFRQQIALSLVLELPALVNTLRTLVVSFGSELVGAVAAAARAIGAAEISVEALGGPIGWVIAAISLLAAAWTGDWGNIQEHTQSAVDDVVPKLQELDDKIADVSASMEKWVVNLAPIGDNFKKFFDGLIDQIRNAHAEADKPFHIHITGDADLSGENGTNNTNGVAFSRAGVSKDITEAINEAASKYGVDPNLLAAIASQETEFGQSKVYNPTTGRSTTPGNNGYGVFQLDPASGASQSDLDKAAHDVFFAADKAAEMMAENIKAANGRIEEALSMYNAGSVTGQGIHYADQVRKRYSIISGADPGTLGTDVLDSNPMVGGESEEEIKRKEEEELRKRNEAARQGIIASIEAQAEAEKAAGRDQFAVWDEEKSRLNDVLKNYVFYGTERQELEKQISQIQIQENERRSSDNKKAEEEEKRKQAQEFSDFLKEADIRAKNSKDHIAGLTDEINALKAYSATHKLTREEEDTLDAKLEDVRKKRQEEYKRDAEERIRQINELEKSIEHEASTELELGEVTRATAEKDIAAAIVRLQGMGRSADDATLALIRLADKMKLQDVNQGGGPDGFIGLKEVENQVKRTEAAIDADTTIKSSRDKLKEAVIAAAENELYAELAVLGTRTAQNQDAYDKILATIENFENTRHKLESEYTEQAKKEIEEQQKAWEEFANKATDKLVSFVDSSKKGFTSLRDDFKKLINDMEKELLKSILMKTLFNVGGSYQDIFSRAANNTFFGSDKIPGRPGADTNDTVFSTATTKFSQNVIADATNITKTSTNLTNFDTNLSKQDTIFTQHAAKIDDHLAKEAANTDKFSQVITQFSQAVAGHSLGGNAANNAGLNSIDTPTIDSPGNNLIVDLGSGSLNNLSNGVAPWVQAGYGLIGSGSASPSALAGMDNSKYNTMWAGQPFTDADGTSSGGGFGGFSGLLGKAGGAAGGLVALISGEEQGGIGGALSSSMGMMGLLSSIAPNFGPWGFALDGAAGIASLLIHHDNQAAMPDKYDTQNYGSTIANLIGKAGANGQTFYENSSESQAFGGNTGIQQIEETLSKYPTLASAPDWLKPMYQQLMSEFGSSATGSGKLNFDPHNIGQEFVSGATGAGGTFSYKQLGQSLQQFLTAYQANPDTSVPVFSLSRAMPNLNVSQVSQVGTYNNGALSGLGTSTAATPGYSGTSTGGQPQIVVQVQGPGATDQAADAISKSLIRIVRGYAPGGVRTQTLIRGGD